MYRRIMLLIVIFIFHPARRLLACEGDQIEKTYIDGILTTTFDQIL